MTRNDLRIRGMELDPTVQVGKAGLTEQIGREISEQLEKRELIKVRFLRSAGPSSEWKQSVEGLSRRIGAELIEIKGATVLLYKRKGLKGR